MFREEAFFLSLDKVDSLKDVTGCKQIAEIYRKIYNSKLMRSLLLPS